MLVPAQIRLGLTYVRFDGLTAALQRLERRVWAEYGVVAIVGQAIV